MDSYELWAKRFGDLADLIRVQCNDPASRTDPYMHGMANGLILAASTVTDVEPAFLEGVRKLDKAQFNVEAAIAATPAPKVLIEDIESIIAHEEYARIGLVTTVCTLFTRSGFEVQGLSACASPENYREDIGRELARKDAVSKLWSFEAYMLKECLHFHINGGHVVNRYDERVIEWLDRQGANMAAFDNSLCQQAVAQDCEGLATTAPDDEWRAEQIRNRALDHAVAMACHGGSGSIRKTAKVIADAEAYADYLRGNGPKQDEDEPVNNRACG